MDQVNPRRYEAYERRIVRDGLAGDQLLAEFGEGAGEYRGAAEERGGAYGNGLSAEREAIPSDC